MTVNQIVSNEGGSFGLKNHTPTEIVRELDKYIVGQQEAKKAVAIALRNRWRRNRLPEEIRREISPKNIIMIGPTGVGKTEIARRLAALASAPFIKVEASKYTEVGYHGRDVESMVRDLVEVSLKLVRDEQHQRVESEASRAAEEKLLDLLLPSPDSGKALWTDPEEPANPGAEAEERRQRWERSRAKLRQKLHKGELAQTEVELNVEERNTPMVEVFSNAGVEQMGFDFQNMFEKAFPAKNKTKKVKVPDALKMLLQQEADKLIDPDKVKQDALERAENAGIIFIDEIDKIIPSGQPHGADVSRQGVQRDLLPIVEGSAVSTRYGVVHTDHILFIAAGAFHMADPSELIPELQGRFPIRVNLQDLTRADFVRILTEPKNALIKQYQALLETENVKLDFTNDGVDEVAELAFQINNKIQNIGARRLHTVMEKLLEEISFHAPEKPGRTEKIDRDMVRKTLAEIAGNEDLSRYIL